jgi:mycothiol synthase
MAHIELRAGPTEALLELLDARDRADYGESGFTRSEVLAALEGNEFTPAHDTVIAYADGEPLGGVALLPPGSLGFVAPAGEGRGAGSALLDWVEQRARARQRAMHRQRVGAGNERAHRLLETYGYTQVREVRHMSISLDQAPAPADPPNGISVGPPDLIADAHGLHEADARMFGENPDYEPVPFDVFRDEHLIGHQPDPRLSSIAVRDGRIVGFTLCRDVGAGVGHVDLLAVDPGIRRRGLGRALLLRALHSFADLGLHEGRLDVASDNASATALYVSVGMAATNCTHVFEKPVRPE